MSHEETVPSPSDVCPGCGEDRIDWLVWIDDDVIECQTCGAHYNPNEE